MNMDHIWVVPRLPEPSETLMIETYKCMPGGKGAIQAIACARLSRPKDGPYLKSKDIDIEVKMIGAVGGDSAGERIYNELKANGVITKGILIYRDSPSGTASIALENSGENNVLVYPGANHKLTPSQISLDFKVDTTHLLILQMEIPTQTVVHVVKMADENSIPVLLNAAPAIPLPREVYPRLQHLIVNKLEAEVLLNRRERRHSISSQHHVHGEERVAEFDQGKRLCRDLLALGVRYVVVTMGASGGVAGAKVPDTSDEIITEYAAETVGDNLVDSTGCGGVFIGAYAVEYIRQMHTSGRFDIVRAVKWAAKAAAVQAKRLGSLDGIPWENEIDPA